jgi:hypothetical protein
MGCRYLFLGLHVTAARHREHRGHRPDAPYAPYAFIAMDDYVRAPVPIGPQARTCYLSACSWLPSQELEPPANPSGSKCRPYLS